MLTLNEAWQDTFLLELSVHGDLFCSKHSPVGEVEETVRLITRFQDMTCEAVPRCE